MPRVVVDANVVVQACLDGGGLGPLAGYDLLAPPIMPSEVVSSLHEMRYRGDISAELARLALERFEGVSYEVLNPSTLWQAAWAIADELGWAKTYDAEYVALAQMAECQLVTLDARLARGAGRLASIIGPADMGPTA